MFGNVIAAQTLARHRADELEHRNEIQRRNAERRRVAARAPVVAPSRPGFAAVLLQSLDVSRPRPVR